MSHNNGHKHPQSVSAGFGLIITSDSRTEKTDLTGKNIIKLLTDKGHRHIGYRITPNKAPAIRRAIRQFLADPRIQLVVTSGGTGCGKKDMTIESARPYFVKELDGFGELFRALSYRRIGSRALMSRAALGITGQNKIIACLPGSPDAVRVALAELLIPELSHILWELSRGIGK
jgi:molybdenum cofactor biosynthesis protein B